MKKKINIPWYFLLLLILAGESVFILPFVLARIFRPTVLANFDLSNTQLGYCFSVYGIVALVSYLFGGPIADRYPPRKLMAIALWMTALGGILYASYPSYAMMKILYGYWGFTTIFLFWAPMIKATRVWGGDTSQGKAFGLLDGGRGLVGALFGAMGVFIFSLFVSVKGVELTISESQSAFSSVILCSSGIVFFVGILVWFLMKIPNDVENNILVNKISTSQIKTVLKLPAVWLLMLIILSAYVGYKITDVFSLYAKEVMLYDEIDSAKVGTFLLFIRPIVGVGIGFLADRSQITKWLVISFIISFLGSCLFGSGLITASATTLFFASILFTATGVYAARALYFAVMKSGKIPLVLTGTAVGMISLIGYTPDIFVGPLIGYFLDSSPGLAGHQHVFWMNAIFSLVGLMASGYYSYLYAIKHEVSS